MKTLILALLLIIALAVPGHAYFSINVEMNGLRPVIGSSSNFLNVNSNFNPAFSGGQNFVNIQSRGFMPHFGSGLQIGGGLNMPVPTFRQGELPGLRMDLNFQRNFGPGLDLHVNAPNFQLPTTNFQASGIRINNCQNCIPCS